jgi:hypothetical protein
MHTNGLTDGLDFLAALSCCRGYESLENGLIVHTLEAWRDLAATREPLILIAGSNLELQASDTAGAVQSGHHIFLSGPRANIAAGSGETLRRQDCYSIGDALLASGYSDSQAISLAKACCGSSSILKRLMTLHPETVFPPWSQDDVRPFLAPFALVGGWTHVDPKPHPREPGLPRIGSDPPIDIEFVTELVGCSNDELEKHLARWQGGTEPLFIRFGDSVFVGSREDAWHLLGGGISAQQIKHFRDLALLVLEEESPAFDLAPDQRWMANLLGKTRSLSEDFRRSLVETLGLMATYPTADAPGASVNFRATVRWILERALPANATWQRWASFGHNLTIVAEADPELFLERIEADLQSNKPALPKLFQDQGNNFFGGAIHSDLLWALEALAWTPEYLCRAAVALAKLAARDPGGTYANRPSNSLREIFLWWLWHTNASMTERIDALSAVLRSEADIGWKLLRGLLPDQPSGISHNTHMPRWRPWADGWHREKLRAQIPQYVMAIANLAMQEAGTDGKKWSEILVGMLRVNAEFRAKVFSALEGITRESNPNGTFALWNRIRSLLSQHERYSDAPWAFDETVRNRLATIRDGLEPPDPVLKHHWLFNHQVELEIDVRKDFAAHDRALHERRVAALDEILEETGATGIFQLLDLECAPSIVGGLSGQKELLGWQDVQLPTILATNDKKRFLFISAFIGGRFNAEGWGFVERLPITDWSISQVATFGRCLPFRADVWQWLGKLGANFEKEYWQVVRDFLRNPSEEDVRMATNCLIRVGRGFSAIEVLQSSTNETHSFPSDLIADVLEFGFSSDNHERAGMAGDIHYPVQQLVKLLQREEAFDRARLARIEWAFLPLLDREFGGVGPDTLVTAINSDPELFVELLKKAYRGENDEPGKEPLTEQEQLMAGYANKLLDRLSQLPGTAPDNTLDCNYLRDWVKNVQVMAAGCARRTICDFVLGQFIARGSQKLEENWPSSGLAQLMEEIGSADFFDGFINGVLNSRGVVSRDPRAGGELERQFVDRYRQLAQNARAASPKLAKAFVDLAQHYQTYAQHEDTEAQRERVGR